jgi:hypothetical protein
MDEAAHKIEAHIEQTRERLGSNLKELKHKVDDATDWREHFRARPHTFLGGAFVGGALLAAALRPKSAGRVFDPPMKLVLDLARAAASTPRSRHSNCGTTSRVRSSAWPQRESQDTSVR